MAVSEDGAEGGLVAGFLDVLRNVELGEDVLVDSSFGANDVDIKVLPGDTELLGLETGS
jgi:hypothetical protein